MILKPIRQRKADIIRLLQLTLRAVQQDAWADEVNKGFDFNIALFEELELHCVNQPQAAWNS